MPPMHTVSSEIVTDRIFSAREDLPRHLLGDPSGLCVELWPHSGVHTIRHGGVTLNQWLAHPLEAGLNRLILRRRDGAPHWTELTGPGSPSAFGVRDARARWAGEWDGLAYDVDLCVDPRRSLWFWRVRVTNWGAAAATCDLLYGQDLGLAATGALRSNEAYTCHYLDHTVEPHPDLGPVILSRQNEAQAGAFPWILHGCLDGARAYATDGFQFFGRSYKATGIPEACLAPELPSKRLQYEFAYAALQSRPLQLQPGASTEVVYFALFRPDHPAPSSREDLALVDDARAAVRAVAREDLAIDLAPVTPTAWQRAPLLPAEDLEAAELDALFHGERRHEEREAGELLSFFHGIERHVALRAKEVRVARPHGAILRSGRSLYPEPETLSATCYAFGIFAGQITAGNTNFNKFLSVCRNPLNAIRTCGLRLFVRDGGAWRLLGVPSAFEMGPGACRWLYKTRGRLWSVSTAVSAEGPGLELTVDVLRGEPCEFLLAHDLVLGSNELDEPCRATFDPARATAEFRPAAGGFTARHYPDLAFTWRFDDPSACAAMGGAELLDAPEADPASIPCWAARTAAVDTFTLRIEARVASGEAVESGRVAGDGDGIEPFLQDALRSARLEGGAGVDRLQEALPWFAHHALVHLTVPHGLEQYGGAAWGTRDVCQGPVEFLLALRHYEPVRRILATVYAHQYEDTGEWPQWFMFDAYREVQFDHSHGDVIFWPLKALCDYVEASGDTAVLDARVPFTRRQGFAFTDEARPLAEHVALQVDRIEALFVPGTALVRYGDGDWDDTLQPADASLRTRMVSAWTVQLCYQVLRGLAAVAQRAGREALAARAGRLADAVQRDFNRLVVRDGVVAGFLVFEADGSVRPLLHPEDKITGIRYRLLPMTRGVISGIFSADQARAHAALLREHLVFPDGAHLMSDPVEYRGGISRLFRRGETAAYFGREVSLQYTHAHIRYAEALARLGLGRELLRALLAVNPVALRATVPNAALRQANAYFSSSDGDFADRYEAFARYGELRDGRLPVNGGWRIYSSGPGIYVRQMIENWLGLRESYDDVVIDPVLAPELDGLVFAWQWHGRHVTLRYRVTGAGCGPTRLALNGRDLAFAREPNPYRTGGARVARRDLLAEPGDVALDVWV